MNTNLSSLDSPEGLHGPLGENEPRHSDVAPQARETGLLDPNAEIIPTGAIEIPTICDLERRRFKCPNNSKFVLLHDTSELGWETYCKLIASGNVKPDPV
jgi:hypothetical protein